MNSEAVSTHRPSKAFSTAGTHLPICRMQSSGARGIAKRLQKRESSAQSSSPNLQELILLQPNNHPPPWPRKFLDYGAFCFWCRTPKIMLTNGRNRTCNNWGVQYDVVPNNHRGQ